MKVPGVVISHSSSQPNHYLTNSRRELESTNTLAMIIGSFLICCLPLMISYVNMAVSEGCSFDLTLFKITTALSHSSTAIIPMILACRIKDVYFAMENVLKCNFKEFTETHSTLHEMQRGTSEINDCQLASSP